ncbi:MAG: hypothetical protein JO288_21730 [Hyphomicrobiales bacterium]|nr:hypothetical protein [Hyphomicrobiales bacterium]
MKPRQRALEAAAYVAAILILAALVHLLVVSIVPRVAARDAFAKLEPLGALDETVALPRASPKERLLPYADPAVAMSFCRFDLALGPIRVTAPTGRAFASISFHTRRGLVFYELTDKAAAHGLIGAVLATPDDIRLLAAHDDEESASRDLRIAAPDNEGYVAMRVFSELPSLYAQAEAEARQLKCRPEPIPK